MAKKSRAQKKQNGGNDAPPVSAPAKADGKPPVAKSDKSKGIPALVFLSIIVLFFASGFSSLIYQVVWTRMLVLVFGATTFATSTVLAIFMGGLALGSFIAGKFCHKIKRPLIWYGVLEAIIGIWAVMTPSMFAAATPVYKAVWQATHASLVELSLLRFACTAVILIVPTTCMGATLPLLARFVTSSLESIGSRVGTLYAVNTLGAVGGALTTGFLILPMLGLSATLWFGANVNMFLLIAVLALAKIVGETKRSVAEPLGETAASQAPKEKLSIQAKLAIGVFAASGAIAMVYEVCWTRTLLMVIGSSTYAFTVMLAAFLIGIFLGSLICARFIDRAKQPILWFAALQVMIGIMTLVSMRSFNQIPYLNLIVSYGIVGDPNASMFVRFFLAGCVLAPITLCLGAIFPVVVKTCTTDLENVGRSVGFLYSANTLGAIIGAFLAGFVLLPLLGAENTLIAGALLNALLGFALLWSARDVKSQRKTAGTIYGVVCMAVLLASSNVWDRAVMLNAQGARRGLAYNRVPYESYQQWKDAIHKTNEVKYWADGSCSNVGVIYHPDTKVTSLITNGHIDASDDKDMPVQALVSGFPLLLRPEAKDVAVVGWGCGQTIGIATLFPVKSIDAIELEPKVIEASKFFHHCNLKPEEDPRVKLHYNDGRNFLLATDKKFDVIVSEPSNPWQAGVCNLFTKEYFAICKNRLKEDGMLAVWMQTAEVPPSDLCSVLASLNSEFSDTMAFYPRPGNLVICAANQPIKIDYKKLQQTLSGDARLEKEFAHVGIPDAAAFLGHIAVAPHGMNFAITPMLNTDDHNILEFNVGRSYEDKMYVNENSRVLRALAADLWKPVDFSSLPKHDQAVAMANIGQDALRYAAPEAAQSWVQKSLQTEPTVEGYKVMGNLHKGWNQMKQSSECFAKALQLQPKNPDLLAEHGFSLLALHQPVPGRKELEQALALDPKHKRAQFILAASYYVDLFKTLSPEPQNPAVKQSSAKILELVTDLVNDKEYCKVQPSVWLFAAQANFKLGDLDKARNCLSQFKQYAQPADLQKFEHVTREIEKYPARKV